MLQSTQILPTCHLNAVGCSSNSLLVSDVQMSLHQGSMKAVLEHSQGSIGAGLGWCRGSTGHKSVMYEPQPAALKWHVGSIGV